MMHFQLAGSGVMSAFYPHESELSRRVKQLIRAAKKQLDWPPESPDNQYHLNK
ncbi:hypothetical protein GRW67_22335 [Escherichia coli]|nr:hypothetical protein [Escherichia coli]MXF70176.1 hypothetical protein [Escherichia coli]MXH28631.1 hypothetical protein [Escherichia coli]